MKKNETKVTNLISNKVAEQLEGIKNSKTTTSKAKAKKTKRNWYRMLKKLPQTLPMLNW